MRRAFREAAVDLYFNSWRLVPANLAWGLALLAIVAAGLTFLPAFGLLPALAIPVAGLHRMAALVARGEAASFSDFIDGMRRYAAPAFAMGAAATVLAIVFSANVVLGFATGGPFGWFLAAMALYGNLALGMLLIAFWPILVDPRHEDVPVRRRLTLAGLLVIARPVRMLVLAFAVGAILAVSAVILAALVMVGVAFVSLLATRAVLPMADEMEARLPVAAR